MTLIGSLRKEIAILKAALDNKDLLIADRDRQIERLSTRVIVAVAAVDTLRLVSKRCGPRAEDGQQAKQVLAEWDALP